MVQAHTCTHMHMCPHMSGSGMSSYPADSKDEGEAGCGLEVQVGKSWEKLVLCRGSLVSNPAPALLLKKKDQKPC